MADMAEHAPGSRNRSAQNRSSRKGGANWIRGLAAGLSLCEIRALMRGDPPGEKPNPRLRAHTLSFLLHLRPRTYPCAAVAFTNTFYLGFFAVFLLAVELVTGLALLVYYQPTPEGAYGSILRIMGEVPFGRLARDIHRLAGEGLIICVALHLLRIFLAGAYKGPRRFTWVIGVGLLVCTLGFAFTGYLRPWDQRAYWAVTIGTSMLEAVPLVGSALNLLVRGGPDIGTGGLLRFNMLHIFLLPLFTALLLGAHYYRISRSHGISLPARLECPPDFPGDRPRGSTDQAQAPVPFLPDMITREWVLTCVGLLVLTAAALYFYDAPLEHHADPRRTPLDTQAPWFFLWLQGLLKLGHKGLMGIVVPLVLLALLLAVPYIDRTPRRILGRRPLALMAAGSSVALLLILSYLGTGCYGINLPAAERIAQDLAPQEGPGPLHQVPFAQFPVGLYDIDRTDLKALPPALGQVFGQFRSQVRSAVRQGALSGAAGVMIIEDWQADLKRITLRIGWEAPGGGERKSFQRMVHLHRER